MEEQTLNIPQLLVIVAITFFAIRWWFSSSSQSGTRQQRTASRINLADVERLSQMFPQLNRRDIMWDLQRNGGNMTATTERVLSGRSLDTAPPSFQPAMPEVRPAASRTSRAAPAKPSHPDLITRYNLSSKINSTSTGSDDSGADTGSDSKGAWSQNKSERQQLLQRRREEMILQARKKMMEKEKAKQANDS